VAANDLPQSRVFFFLCVSNKTAHARGGREMCVNIVSVVQVHTGRQPWSSSVIVSVGVQGEGCSESRHSETSSCRWSQCTDCIHYHGCCGMSSPPCSLIA